MIRERASVLCYTYIACIVVTAVNLLRQYYQNERPVYFTLGFFTETSLVENLCSQATRF